MLSSLPCFPGFWWYAAPTSCSHFQCFFCHSLSSCMHITVFQIQQTWIVTVSYLSDLCTCIQVFGNGVTSKSDWFEPAQYKLLTWLDLTKFLYSSKKGCLEAQAYVTSSPYSTGENKNTTKHQDTVQIHKHIFEREWKYNSQL